MSQSTSSRRPWLPVALVLCATSLFALELHRSSANNDVLFRFASPIQTPTRAATATSAVFDSPLATPTPWATTPASSTPSLGAVGGPHQYLPLVRNDPTLTPTPTPTPLMYGWKGTAGGDVASPDWYYTWQLMSTPFPAAGASQPTELERLEAGLAGSAKYAPMVWCTSDVNPVNLPDRFPSPAEIAELARRYPGRVWLMFNEPDNDDIEAGCGGYINQDSDHSGLVTGGDWRALGDYVGQEYARYYHAIKGADRTARVYTVAPLVLPMPNLTGLQKPGGVAFWNGFLGALSAAAADMDGVAIHAYPNNPSTHHLPACHYGDELEAPCVQEALLDAYRFFHLRSWETP